MNYHYTNAPETTRNRAYAVGVQSPGALWRGTVQTVGRAHALVAVARV